jgi:hypothetical protein
MISSDGISVRRWIVSSENGGLPGSESRLPGEPPAGVDVEFAGPAALASLGNEHLKAAACAFKSSLSQTIRQSPYRAVMIAAGVGVLAGILLKRPFRHS